MVLVRMSRHHHDARPLEFERAWRPDGFERELIRAHQRRALTRQGRGMKLSTASQSSPPINSARPVRDALLMGEGVRDVALCYNVSHSTISRL
jgi:hypothetical protein